MTLLLALKILQGARELIELFDLLQAAGHDLNAPLPPEHQAKLDAYLTNVSTAQAATEWDEDHQN